MQTQMHSPTPFGADLFHDDMIEDNMRWNFVAGLTMSREMLENYGCIVRVISPRLPNSAFGTGGILCRPCILRVISNFEHVKPKECIFHLEVTWRVAH